MKSIIKNTTFCLVFSLLIAACTQQNNLALETETPVVQAYLFAGQPVDSISIQQSFSYTRANTDLTALDDLALQISDGREIFSLTHNGGGIYQNRELLPKSGQNYTLTFEYNGTTVSSETFIPQKRAVTITKTTVELEKITTTGGFGGFGGGAAQETIEITWDNAEGDYYYVVIENIEDNPEFVNDFFAEFEANGFSRRLFQITEPRITDFHPINSRRDLTQFGTYQIIVYRVNPEYAALYETAGSSSVTIAEPPSNIENGLGIFTGVSSDTIYLEVEKI